MSTPLSVGQPQKTYRTDPYFRDLLGPHPDPKALKSLIIEDGGVVEPITVWQSEGVLVDGHHRDVLDAEARAEGHDLRPLPVQFKSFADRAEAEQYVYQRCMTRRHLTPGYRACQYLRTHTAEFEMASEAARAAQAHADGNAVPAHAPKAPIDLRKQIAETVGISAKVAQVAIDLHRRIADPDADQHVKAKLMTIREEFEKGLAYRTVEHALAKMDENRSCDEVRCAVIDDFKGTIEPTSPTASAGIICGDAKSVVEHLVDDFATLFLTSPYYPITDYGYFGRAGYDGDYAKYLDGLKSVFAACYRKLRTGGKFILQVDEVNYTHESSGKRISRALSADLVRVMREVGYEYLDSIGWYKQHTSGNHGRVRWGTHMSARCPKIRRTHEDLLVFFKGTPVLEGDDELDTISGRDFRMSTLSQWYIPPETRKFRSSDGQQHPCPFPEELAYWCIQLYTRQGDLVVDPFCGTGTVPYVAHCLGRKYVGIDLAPQSVEISQKRLSDVADKTAADRRKGIRRFLPEVEERADGHGLRKHPMAVWSSTRRKLRDKQLSLRDADA